MDLKHINDTMLQATQESVESFAFAEIFAANESIDLDEFSIQIQMDITSPGTGTFILHASQEMLEVITQSLFPPDKELTEAQINDLASELLNTIGGNFLTKILPDNTSFSLGLPEVTSPALPDEQNLLHWDFTLEEIPFSLYLIGEIIHTL